jgi:hypothetical protein
VQHVLFSRIQPAGLIVAATAVTALLVGSCGHAPQTQLRPVSPAAQYGRLPLLFEENRGQADRRFHYMARGARQQLLLAPDEAVLVVRTGGPNGPPERIGMRFLGADPGARPEGTEWLAGIPTYGRVRYQKVYPGVDLVFYGRPGELEYDFEVAPGSDPGSIRLQLSGAAGVTIDGSGSLRLKTRHGEVHWKKPVAYQPDGAGRNIVPSEYVQLARNEIGFQIGSYDRSRPLVIDPVMVFSTYLGGSDTDAGYGIAVDSAGCAYVCGETGSVDFPLASPLRATAQARDGYLVKLNPAGTGFVYATYIGGAGDDRIWGVAVDGAGAAYVTGSSASAVYPQPADDSPRGVRRQAGANRRRASVLDLPGRRRGTSHRAGCFRPGNPRRLWCLRGLSDDSRGVRPDSGLVGPVRDAIERHGLRPGLLYLSGRQQL